MALNGSFCRSYRFEDRSFTVTFLGSDGERRRYEQQLINARVPLRLPDRAAWARAQPEGRFLFAGVADDSRTCVHGFGVQLEKCRALPGHLAVRVERLGKSLVPFASHAGLRGLVDFAKADRRIVLVHAQVFSRDESVRREISSFLEELGFRRADRYRSYRSTLVLDLDQSEEETFASLHGTARRHIRAVKKNPTVIRSIEDPALGKRVEDLTRETLRRTGGIYQHRDWSALIDWAAAHPKLGRVVGLFRTDMEGDDSLLAYATGLSHGDHVQYAYAASTRETDLRMPLGYAPAWDLICWAKRTGASWFDFGGITPGSNDDEDPLGGISDFKRYFGRNVVRVGEEWILEPQPLKAAAARTIRAGAALARRVAAKAR